MEKNKQIKNEEPIITSDDIFVILNEYRIGKKPLAKLLGWGETTIIRYIDGDIPTSEYSNKLRTLLNNPVYYLKILNQNKDKLTGVAYRKSKNAVLNKLMGSKLDVVAQYIVNITEGQICASAVQAMLYYTQGFSLAIYDVELFEEDYIISEENMPYPKIYKNMISKGISPLDIGEEALSSREKELIQGVVEVFNWYGPKALKAILSYEKIALKVSKDKFNNNIISKDTLKDYFKDIIEQYNINSIVKIAGYTDQRMFQIKSLIR
ncbi:hypothetical protein EDD66_101128 [Mobilisporobacter senegalensis]|uniref:Uncharacterized protein n=1 Tax=Mobilisporobacter senegalensis TaxID=1329262 RepID=A0A3N1XZ48_9FIRM|nr:hypothetical protein [Mobilisporobacter senegalensis]ROR31511.1 hypothetical protein EDD66_101128 [Mobilisporobacter senegalensis]